MQSFILIAVLLLSGAECMDARCGDSVAPSETVRRFVFAQGRRYTLGTLAAGAARVACEGSARIDLRFDVEDRVSEKIQVRVTSADGGAWEMEMTGDAIERGVELRVPPAAYDVVVRASRHVAYATSVSAVAAGASITATLRALRVIDGLVVDAATGAAVSGARVHVEPGMESATARDGRFVLEIDPAKWPRQIVVRADGYGSRIVPLPAARADASLRTIALKPGRTVLAEIHSTRPGELVQVELVRLREDGRLVRLPIQAQRIAKDDRFTHTVRFEDVEPGDYVVLAEGSEPSQRAGVRVNVDEVDPPPLSIQLTPFRLRLRTTQNGEPFEGRAVLRQMDAYWEVPVAIGAKGDATIELWEGGRFTATVESRANAPFRARRTIDAGEDLDWQIEMPRAEVTGKVVDAETGAPVPNAAVALEMRSQRPFYRLSVSDVAGPDGAFRFAPVFAGEHIVKAAAAGYPATEVRYELGESDEQRSITIALKRTPSTMLSVLNARGLPIADADVFVCRGSVQLDRGRTDGSGKTPVFIPESEARDVFVVPPDGSLGIIRLSSGAPDAEVRLAEGASRILLRAETESHDPLPLVVVDVRYNGHLLPDEVMMALVGRGSKITSDADGRIVLHHMPPGVYEFWPVVDPQGFRAKALGRAPVRIVAVAGENAATMTFTPAP